MKTAIRNLSFNELKRWSEKNKLPKYRTDQIFYAIYSGNVNDFNNISTIPADLRTLLNEEFLAVSLELVEDIHSADGSIKFLFRTHDQKYIECVFMPHDSGRNTLCISTMTGCPIGCVFCASGKIGDSRKLSQAEILDQVFLSQSKLNSKLTNLVFMGIGEPLLNYENVVHSIEMLTSENNHIFSHRKITLSTVGVPLKIRQLASLKEPVKLAISLHATTDGDRSKIIPTNKTYSLSEIMNDVEFYYRKTHLPITYEYILFSGFNDSDNDAKRLAKIARRVSSKINIIPFNEIALSGIDSKYKPVDEDGITLFIEMLESYGVKATRRKSFGSDISAACGQLAGNKIF